MTWAIRLLGALLLASLAALLATSPARAQGEALSPARTISNVAAIEWDSAGERARALSNRVDLELVPTSPLSLTAYRFTSNSASVQLPVSAPFCGNEGAGRAELAAAWRAEPLLPASASAITEFRPGEPFLFSIAAADRNRDASTVDTIEVKITAASGDSQLLTVQETGANTGQFTGFIQTSRIPPTGSDGDCRLSVPAGDNVEIAMLAEDHRSTTARTELRVLVDPFGYVFDSRDGSVISGIEVTLIDVATGKPADVFGDDGVSHYPATVTTGGTVVDSGGTTYQLAPGLYRFPLAMAGSYRLQVRLPGGLTAPSHRSPAELAELRQPDGAPFTIDIEGSYGNPFALVGPEPVQISIPIDRQSAEIQLIKQVSSALAQPGDALRYRIEVRNPNRTAPTGALTLKDQLPNGLRLRLGSVKLNGTSVTPATTADGREFELVVPALAPGATTTVTYAVDVRPDARPGDALNRAQVRDDRGNLSNVADASVRIRRDTLGSLATIIGRIVEGGCGANLKTASGVAGVRVMLEDGSYAVTDRDGRYHFEAVEPGDHVVQVDEQTLPADWRVADCTRNTRSAGWANSRFVEARGGSLKRVDFQLSRLGVNGSRSSTQDTNRPPPPTDAVAAGAERDWLKDQATGIAWLFPAADHNPRAPLIRVAVKHAPGQQVRLFSDGRPVDAIAFEGSRTNATGDVAVSLWRGVPLEKRSTHLKAEVRDAAGNLVSTLERSVYFGGAPVKAELLRERSVLVADGVKRPVLAVRLTDRDGRPVRHGTTGEFELPAPYYPAVEADAQQARQLAGLERARPFWRVDGDEGVAFIELEPTTASGAVSLRFKFRDDKTEREQRLESWLEPGERPWTIVGLAEGTVGFDRLLSNVEPLDRDSGKAMTDGRLALYAKGRVRGKWLLTLAYDSDKRLDETRFAGAIDPETYYTVFADRSERRYDARSVRRLYLKLERPQFYALFGDFETGIDEPELTRYVRTFNGVKAEFHSRRVTATAFAADTPNRHRRDEIQGNGLSGPYALGARDILANSERISIETRDQFRSERIVARRELVRHIDYDIDYPAGTLRFREPILSRDSGLNPQFVIAEYEVAGIGSRQLNGGGRVSWRSAGEKLTVAATVIHDDDGTRSAALIGADVRYRSSSATEIRAEAARSSSNGQSAAAWQIEAEHHTGKVDVLAYYRERQSGFGLGQTSAAEDGTRKYGVDGALRIDEQWTVTASAWKEDYLDTDARRIAARALIEHQGRTLTTRAGLTFANDQLADGRDARSTVLQFGASKRLFDNKLELDAQTELPLGEQESIDFPARHRLSARYAVTSWATLVGTYEIAKGTDIDARTARLGFDLTPWAGARISASGNVQNIAEYGPRTFAAFGLSQSVVLDQHWSADFTVDSNKTLDGIDPARVLNPLHPVASGGFIGSGGLTEDFTAVTAGATYRSGSWSVTARAEYRTSDQEERRGLTLAALRQIGEGSAVGASLGWYQAAAGNGSQTRSVTAQVSWAHRPAASNWSWLEKLEFREDRLIGAIAGTSGPLGGVLTVSGNAVSRRVVNSLSLNYSQRGQDGGIGVEASVFWGTRFASERLDGEDIAGWSNVVAADLRVDVGPSFDFGVSGAMRHGMGARAIGWSFGPNLGISPAEGSWMSVGWNLVGFADRDFEEARYTRSGPYVTLRLKFDQHTFDRLGLLRRR